MSNLTRWEPMHEMMSLREAMDRLFDDAFTRPVSMRDLSAMPLIDLSEDDDEITVKAVLPGLKPEDVQISVTADVLTIKGEFKNEDESKNRNYLIRERRFGSFERMMQLPTEVQTEKAHADFADGILTIRLPKAEAVKPKSISIKVK
ncbi:Hsp20/alpha crystallin family protein [Levilinea saccharolytica]|uniref:Heat shock protein Hsp20 n=1 Tax=Levilinea saccharolytica TaxID=229921 RepID=A0A0M9U2V6_9CHLR|nr:Hsp20/alpha crystallin family protein [Levilinea saccharolytica]KPL91564.1 hypothetical protein ADN01_01195 [Levilinea saccharolytica]GAP19103.1 heat shock protein Hsp20 [Levilinea saccharolytica]